MHLLFLSPELLTVGGMQRQNRLIAAALDHYASLRGGVASVLCLNDPPAERLPPELCASTVTKFRFFSGNRKSFVWSFGRQLRRATLVIYGLLGFAPLIALHKVVNPEARSLLQLHGREAWTYRSRLHAWAARQMDGFVAVSRYTLDTFRNVYQLSEDHADFVVPNSVSPEFLQAAPARDPAEADALRLLTVSRLDSADRPKGIDTAIRAMPLLLKEFPQLLYVVVGDGVDRSRLESLAKDLGVLAGVRFLGFVPDDVLREEYARCTLYVMPSAKEGFGLAFIEAMASGKPVVAARARAVPEVVEHGRTGLLVEYGNVPQLAEAMSTLLGHDEVRRRMGVAAQRTVREEFTFDALCTKLFSVLDSFALG